MRNGEPGAEERRAEYFRLRDSGMDPGVAIAALEELTGLSVEYSTGRRYEQWYQAARGIPADPAANARTRSQYAKGQRGW